MTESDTAARPGPRPPALRWPARIGVLAILVAVVGGVWASDLLLTERFAASVRSRADLRLALHSGNVQSELQRSSVVPLLLARDPELIGALKAADFSQSSQRLISFQAEIAAAGLFLLDDSGRTVAATDRNQLGVSHRQDVYFVEALRARETVFTVARRDSGGFEFSFARAVLAEGKVIGVVAVVVDLMKFERAWTALADAMLVTDSEGAIILATEPRWRGETVEAVLAAEAGPATAGQRLSAALARLAGVAPDAFLAGQPVMRSEARIPFRGWRILGFTGYETVRERVNTVLALEIMGLAILLALAFYLRQRRALLQSARFRRESDELRALNARLQREIAEREKAEHELRVAEQTLEQSSKLAILGEMAAGVSHELNQPLAAMKTYLAGARLLLQRRRSEEAQAAFQRIDDLIERMGAITRQLKSYARKGGEALAPVDLRACLGMALSMMEPQQKARAIRITRTVPRSPVMVMADRVRIEQVIVNLMRNAIDATRDRPDPEIELVLAGGEAATLTVRDNGHGIVDLDKLFEPFWTTKKPGDGVGLGLAISSGIVRDHGGRLTAQNADGGGAVFEMQLPLLAASEKAAE
ncbi:MAG: sensor histidine kinase [Rhodobacteraceae bacterium]|nr:sensor histidine kinase [Paracoccaceae bacterium]